MADMEIVAGKRMRTAAGVAVGVLIACQSFACAGPPGARTGAFDVLKRPVALGKHTLDLTLVKPAKPRSPATLLLFATGDAGWMGASGVIADHLAQRGDFLAACDSRQLVKPVKRSTGLVAIEDAAAGVATVVAAAKTALGLPDSIPVIVTGFSRGANVVVFTAGVKSLQPSLEGAIAIALTRETDFLKPPESNPALKLDEQGRIQTYPAIALAGSIPFAVIQSSGDGYVPAAEARGLFGPDTPTRRFYDVPARSHGFNGGRDTLLRDLDDALNWIESSARPR